MEDWKEYAILNTRTGNVRMMTLRESPKYLIEKPNRYAKVENCEYLAERGFEKVYEKDHAVIQAQLASKKDSFFVSNVRVKMRNILTSRKGFTYEQAQVLNKLFEMGIAETK